MAITAVIAIVVILSACGGSSSSSACPAPGDPDGRALTAFDGHVKAWNSASGDFALTYVDPSVSREQWLMDAPDALRRMREALQGMQAQFQAIESSELVQLLNPVYDNYGKKYGAATNLYSVVADESSSQAQVGAAGTRLDQVAAAGRTAAEKLQRDLADLCG